MNKNNMKTVGILGIESPYATAMFFKNILDLTPAKKAKDHFRIIIDNNPHIPCSLHTFLNGEESTVQAMIESCKSLSSHSVDFIVIPSNEAAHFLPEVRKSIKTPILDVINITSNALHDKYPDIKYVAVLGDILTYQCQTYKTTLEKKRIKIYQYDKQVNVKILSLIEELKSGKHPDELRQFFISIIQDLKNHNVEGIILASSELTVFKNENTGIPLVDSSYVLAAELVQIALSQKMIPLDMDGVYAFWEKRSKLLSDGEVSDYQSTLLTINKEAAEQRNTLEKDRIVNVINQYRDKFKGVAIEYGCGVGRITEVLATFFERVDGIDYCSEFIKKARKNATVNNINNVRYSVSSIDEFMPDEKYDCAICSGIIEYQDENQFLRLVSSIDNSLKHNGVCLLRESVGFQKRFELHGFFSSVLSSPYNAVYRTSEEIVYEFSKYGFSLIHEEITLPNTPDKPETCQKILLLEKHR